MPQYENLFIPSFKFKQPYTNIWFSRGFGSLSIRSVSFERGLKKAAGDRLKELLEKI